MIVQDEQVLIAPQKGTMQERFLASRADIAISGGTAGCGKTIGLIFEPLRHIHRAGFRALMFRRTSPEITSPGGLWDETKNYYRLVGGEPTEVSYRWSFPSGAWIRISHMQHEDDAEAWKGAQIPLIEFDQLETFTERQWWYMFSRNRSASEDRLAPYIRATCNPVPEDDFVGGWLNKLIAWWIDDDGYPRWERSGLIRWFARINEEIIWGNTREEVRSQAPLDLTLQDIKSLTFIPGKLTDNPLLLARDPGYEGRLKAMPYVERMRLLAGNWHVKPAAGLIFNRAWFGTPVGAIPAGARRVRYWDKAGTQDGGRYSAGVKLAGFAGRWYVEHVERGQWSSMNRNAMIRQTAALDGPSVSIVLEVEPGSGGKESGEISVRELAGYDVHLDKVTGDKLTRARPLSAQAEAGNVRVLAGPWNDAFLSELHRFTGEGNEYSDQVDAVSGGFNWLCLKAGFEALVTTQTKSTASQHQGEDYRDPRFGEGPERVWTGGIGRTVLRYKP